MTQTILGKEASAYKKSIRYAIAVLSAAAVMCVVFNLSLILCVSDATKTLFTVLNIVSDVVVFSLIYGYIALILKEKQRKYRLYATKDTYGERISGEILSVKGREIIEKFECMRVLLLENEKQRVIYFPICTNIETLLQCKQADFLIVNNIAVEVKYEVEDKSTPSL
jgi:hypothetical protein